MSSWRLAWLLFAGDLACLFGLATFFASGSLAAFGLAAFSSPVGVFVAFFLLWCRPCLLRFSSFRFCCLLWFSCLFVSCRQNSGIMSGCLIKEDNHCKFFVSLEHNWPHMVDDHGRCKLPTSIKLSVSNHRMRFYPRYCRLGIIVFSLPLCKRYVSSSSFANFTKNASKKLKIAVQKSFRNNWKRFPMFGLSTSDEI